MNLSDLISLKGKIAVVTGGGRGIGQSTCARLGEAGAHVVVVDVNEADAAETAKQLPSAEIAMVDITDAAAVKTLFTQLGQKHGRVDILVNNAGIFPMRQFAHSDDALWQKTFDVNVMGSMRCIRECAPHMKDGGSIINLASIAGLHPEGDLAHYDTSKAAVIMMTKSLAWELREQKIRVNAVAPGGIQTPGARLSIEPLLADPKRLMARSKNFMSRIALKRMGEPDDIARAILFFASPMSDYVTGALLVVDGGFLLS